MSLKVEDLESRCKVAIRLSIFDAGCQVFSVPVCVFFAPEAVRSSWVERC